MCAGKKQDASTSVTSENRDFWRVEGREKGETVPARKGRKKSRVGALISLRKKKKRGGI